MADKLPAGLFEAAYWYEGLKERTNETFMPLYFDKHRILVLKGGGGSGKSIFAGQKILERVTTEGTGGSCAEKSQRHCEKAVSSS